MAVPVEKAGHVWARTSLLADPGAAGVLKMPVNAVVEASTALATVPVMPELVTAPPPKTPARPGQYVPAVAHDATTEAKEKGLDVVTPGRNAKPGARSVHAAMEVRLDVAVPVGPVGHVRERTSAEADPGAAGVVKAPVKAVAEASTALPTVPVMPELATALPPKTAARPGQYVPAVAHDATTEVIKNEPDVVTPGRNA